MPKFCNDPQQALTDFIEKANSLKTASNGEINLFKCGHIKYTALDYFYSLNKGLEADKID